MASGIFYPAASGDDGERYASTNFNATGLSTYLGGAYDESIYQFFRFVNVSIPQGTTIEEAYIKFTAYANNSEAIVNVDIAFVDEDNPSAPTTYGEFDALTLTTKADWDNIGAWVNGTQYDTPELKTILQPIVDRVGFGSGNAVIARMGNNGSTANRHRQISMFDYLSGAEKAELHVTWSGLTIINLTEPFSSEASIQSNTEITISQARLAAETSMSVGNIFEGILVDCTSPLIGTSSLQSDAKISIPSVILTTQSEIQGDVQINIQPVTFTTTSSMSINEIWRGYILSCPSPMSAQLSLQSIPQIEVNQSLFTSSGSLYVQPEIQLFTGSLSASGSISAIITDPFSVAILPRVYTFTLTGVADGVDDIVIPIKSFQSRLKSGDPTYLSVVIPGTDYASAINLRLNGNLVMRMGYLSGGEIILSEIISIVDFENIIVYDGTISKTITLDGHRTETFTPKEINLTGSSYKNITAGKLRYRCTPNLYVRPGDTVNIDNDSFTIENITYSVSPELEIFEVSE